MAKQLRKKKKRRYEGFDLIPKTSGKISNGVYISKDKSELIISFAWGCSLRFRPLKENEKSL